MPGLDPFPSRATHPGAGKVDETTPSGETHPSYLNFAA